MKGPHRCGRKSGAFVLLRLSKSRLALIKFLQFIVPATARLFATADVVVVVGTINGTHSRTPQGFPDIPCRYGDLVEREIDPRFASAPHNGTHK